MHPVVQMQLQPVYLQMELKLKLFRTVVHRSIHFYRRISYRARSRSRAGARARDRVRTGSPRLSGDFRVGLLRLPGPVLRSGGCLPRGARGSDDDDDRRGGDTWPRHQRAQREPGEEEERVGAGIGPRAAHRRSGFGGRPAAASHPRTSR